MVKNIIKNKGGLHNRITSKIHLMPFTLGETREYLQSRGVRWPEQMLAECYMVMGGIPYYLQQIDRSMSLAQNVDRMFFKENASLGDEFENLYSSLFAHSGGHMEIVRVLARKREGLTRDEIVKETSLTDGGGLTRRLTELEQCGFIRRYSTINNARQLYQLTDFYTQFCFQFLAGGKTYDDEQWLHLQGTSKHNSWLGLSFERLCFAHMPQIRRALGIAGVATKTFAYQTDGAQVDMVIERADKTVCMCEMKWSAMPYAIKKAAGKREKSDACIDSSEREQARAKLNAAGKREKSDACIDSSEREQARAKLNAENGKIGNRLMAVREKYPRYALMVVMVTSGGLVQNRRTSERRGRAGSDYPEREGGKPEVNEYAMQTVQREVTLEDLFW